MAAARNGGAAHAQSTITDAMSMLQAPSAKGMMAAQRMALEATRFWAKRMRAYADQMEMLATCSDPNQWASAQAQFFERMTEDYASETAVMTDLMRPREEDADQAA